MEIIQASWRGSQLNYRRDENSAYVTMMGGDSLLYFPVVVEPNSAYRLTIEIRRDSGNGIACCNIFGNQKFDFPHAQIYCSSSEWETHDIDLQTAAFPKTLPLVFRLWRKPDGTGNLSIRRIIVGKILRNPLQITLWPEKKDSESNGVATSFDAVAVLPPEPPSVRQYVAHQSAAVISAQVMRYVRFDNSEGSPKVLFLHYTDNNISQFGLTDAFIENGFNVCSFCFNQSFDALGHRATQKAILDLAKTFKPDWIHMQLQFFDHMVSADTIREVRAVCPSAYITNWTADIRSIAMPYFVEIGKIVHRPLITSEGQLALYRSAGCKNVDYWQIGYDPKHFYRKSERERADLRERRRHDVSFCANRNLKANFPGAAMRERIAVGLSRLFVNRFGLYGYKWDLNAVRKSFRGPVGFYQQNDIYNGSVVAVSSNHFNDIRKYFSDRQLVCLATGTLTVSSYIPGLEEYFTNGKDLVWFKTPEECVELCRHYAQHPNEAEEIGATGAKKALAEHTYFQRVAELSKRLGFK